MTGVQTCALPIVGRSVRLFDRAARSIRGASVRLVDLSVGRSLVDNLFIWSEVDVVVQLVDPLLVWLDGL